MRTHVVALAKLAGNIMCFGLHRFGTFHLHETASFIGDSVADPGSEFFHPGSRVKKIPDPESATNYLSIFNSKNCF